jgi:hypothetical protein
MDKQIHKQISKQKRYWYQYYRYALLGIRNSGDWTGIFDGLEDLNLDPDMIVRFVSLKLIL